MKNWINTIQLGNAYEMLKEIPDKSIDLVIIDPPYEYTTGGGGGCFGSKNKKHFEEIYQEKLYNPEKVDSQIWKHIFWEMFENVKKDKNE